MIYHSHRNIGETVFIEIERFKLKNIIIGCFYRHTKLQTFNEIILEETLKKLSKDKNKTCILVGDFNSNFLALDEHEDTESLYEILSSYCYQP